MDDASARFEPLLGCLDSEEELLVDLIDGAERLGLALVASDFEAIKGISGGLTVLVERLNAIEERRATVIATLGFAGLPLSAIAAAALDGGFAGVRAARERLLMRAHEFHTVQARNAALVLAAARLRNRWAGMLAGLVAPACGGPAHAPSNRAGASSARAPEKAA